MRISDWSSDVCSSDLQISGLTSRRLATHHLLRFASPSDGPLAVSMNMSVNSGPAMAIRTRMQIDGKRSEEHTSELQSLMRISYAVFCLKKKNYKTPDKRQHFTRHRTKKTHADN